MNISVGQKSRNKKKPIWVYSSSPHKWGRNNKKKDHTNVDKPADAIVQTPFEECLRIKNKTLFLFNEIYIFPAHLTPKFLASF